MKIAVNLASHPYIELRPIYNRLRTWIVILAIVGGALWYLYRNESDEARAARAQVVRVETRVQDLEQKQQKYRQLMLQPKEAAILQQSDFLNSQFQRKAFSWTATMTDLETVLPNGVQVLSLDPIVAQDGHVIIRLRVTGDREHALDLVRNLEKSRHFAAPRLASESLATAQGNPGMQNVSANSNLVNFDILADYRPLPLAPSEEGKTTRGAQKPGEAQAGQAAPGKAVRKPGESRTQETKHPHAKSAGATHAIPRGAKAGGRTP